jgi:hypothetical protein
MTAKKSTSGLKIARSVVRDKKHEEMRPQRREITASESHRLAGIKRLAAAGGPSKILRIPITNVLDGSDYSASSI